MPKLFGQRKRKRTVDGEPHDGHDGDAGTERAADPPTAVAFAPLPRGASLDDLGLAAPLVETCRRLAFRRPTPVQRAVVPFLVANDAANVLVLAATGTGKTASFVLPILHRLAADPYGIYAVVLTPTRELAKQIHQQVVALGSAYDVKSALVVGGLDAVRQSTELDRRPHFCVATPGRLAQLLRGPRPPRLDRVRYLVLDEADRLLATNSGFERDVAELLLHCTTEAVPRSAAGETGDGATAAPPATTVGTARRSRTDKFQTLLFSATMTKSLEAVEELAGAGMGRLRLHKFVIPSDESEPLSGPGNHVAMETSPLDAPSDGPIDDHGDSAKLATANHTPKIPPGLRQEYVFMPSRVRDAYLLVTIRTFMANAGRRMSQQQAVLLKRDVNEDEPETGKARSAIIFVSTCERAGFVSGLLSNLGVDNVALHSLLSQNRRLAALGKFQSQGVRILVATDVASRGLDIPTVDLVINSELPRSPTAYVHRVGRTARAGARGKAISLVSESEIGLVHAAERISGRPLEKCVEVTDDAAIKVLGPIAKAARLTRIKLDEIGFDELVQKFKERKLRDKKERERIDSYLKKMEDSCKVTK